MRTAPQTDKTLQTAGKARDLRESAKPDESNSLWRTLAVRPAPIQAKLTVSQANDPQEHEADEVADRVLRVPHADRPSPLPISSRSSGEAQLKCDECEDEEEQKVQRKESEPMTHAPVAASANVPEVLNEPGHPLDADTSSFMESRFGRDFSDVRIHSGPRADASARRLNSLAFTLGHNVAFREGQYSPGTDHGRRLLAHELTHVVQQRDPGSRAIQRQEAKPSTDAQTGAAAAAAPAPAARPDPLKVEAINTTGVVTALHGYILNTRGDFIAVVDQGTQLKITGKPRDADLEKVQKGDFWAKPGDTKPGLYDLYYEVQYFGRMSGSAQDIPIKGYIYTSWMSLTAPPSGPSAAMTANDWMANIPDHGQKGDPAAITKAATAIEAERKAIERRAFRTVEKDAPTVPRSGLMSKEDARTKAYRTWLDATDTRPVLAKSADDIRWRAFRKLFDAEGDPSKIMTYDATNITWGVGFSGAGKPGVGATEQMMARLFNQSKISRDAFWRAGITVVGTELIAVRIINAAAGRAEKLHGTQAENFVREQQDLLSLMTNITIGIHQAGQKDPDQTVRQQNLDAQFETFMNNTLAGSDGIIDKMSNDAYAAAVAAHSVHSGQHGWGQYKGVTGIAGVEAAIRARIRNLEDQNAAAKAAGQKPKVSFIIPLSQIEANIKK